jgi:hypothetical protein
MAERFPFGCFSSAWMFSLIFRYKIPAIKLQAVLQNYKLVPDASASFMAIAIGKDFLPTPSHPQRHP